MSEIPRGAIRFNTDSNKPELWDGSQWAEFQLSTPNLGTNLTPTGSVYFNGSAYLTVPTSTDFGLVEQDWTVECYAYIEQMVGSYGRLWYLEGDDAADLDGVYFSNTHFSMGTTNSWSIGDGTNGEYLRNRWLHVAVVHDSTNMRMYLDGKEVHTTSNNFRNNSTKKLTLMSTNNVNHTGTGKGWISNFRIINGTALYTANFTPPTAPLTNVTNTKLLCCQSTSSATTAAVTPNSIVNSSATASSFGPFKSDTQPGTRGIIRHSGATDRIDYLNLSSTGDALDFEDTSTIAKVGAAMCSSSTRGLMMGGYDAPTANFTNHIEFLTISSTGSAGNDFGDLVTPTYVNAACSNATRGISAGGIQIGSGNLNKIEYVTIASEGVNAQTFGTLSGTRYGSEGMASPVRGLFAGGYAPGNINTIDMITISTLGNAEDYGDLKTALADGGTVSNAVRGLFAGTGPNATPAILNVIEYVTIASTGNASDFGDLTEPGRQIAGLSSPTRGVFAGRNTNPGTPQTLKIIDYVNIASQGDATDFGDLTARTNPTGCSNAHGGL